MTDRKPEYECNLCGFTTDSLHGIKVHITSGEDETHEGRESSEPGLWTDITNTDEIAENNQREEHEGSVTTELSAGKYNGPAEGLDLTGQHISERPYTEAEKFDALDIEEKVVLEFAVDDLPELLSSDLPDEMKRQIILQLLAI